MAAYKKKEDENYEKPSKHKMWNERSGRPVATRPMTKDEIEEHRVNLVRSYQCENDDITIDFQKITDENDEDRDDCIWLKYRMKCILAGKPTIRDVFIIKLPIPDGVRQMAENLRKQQAAHRYSTPLLPAPTSSPVHAQYLALPAPPPVQSLPQVIPANNSSVNVGPPKSRPKLRRPRN